MNGNADDQDVATEPKPVKNIVLCSDGTGNSGGKDNETNVWRLYKGVDIRSKNVEQVAYYHDGVGTQNFKYLKAVSGGVGLGFSRNVREMYKFLVRAYDPEMDNRIYLFGFSRGAFTARAFAAFIADCGIIDSASDDELLDQEIKILVNDYHSTVKKRIKAKKAGDNSKLEVQSAISCTELPRIEFIGVWDTVSAVGVPFGFGFEYFIKKLFKFHFFDLDLNKKVRYARHAVALDDERKSFHPLVWNEQSETVPDEGLQPRIKQVWFSGMHSNVGGGYPKQGLSYEALGWMLDEIALCGEAQERKLEFEPNFVEEMHVKADVFDMMYDSRSGAAAYYRPKIRNVGQFCNNSGIEEVKVHASVFRRIAEKGRNYHPVSLPTDLPLVSVPGEHEFCQHANSQKSARAEMSSDLTTFIRLRDSAYLSLVFFTISLVAVVLEHLIDDSFRFLLSLIASFYFLYLVELFAQKSVKARTLAYISGFTLIGIVNWAIWYCAPEMSFVPSFIDKLIIPLLLGGIVATVGIKQAINKQACFSNNSDTAPELSSNERYPMYFRWESCAISAVFVICILLVHLDRTFTKFPEIPALEAFASDLLMTLFNTFAETLPKSIASATGLSIEDSPVLCLLGLVGMGLAFWLMRLYRRKIVEIQEASWDVVRRAHSVI